VNLGAKGQHATSRPPKPLACHGNACILMQSVFIKDASIPTVMSFSVPEVEISEIF
jgi:hypothetical protein